MCQGTPEIFVLFSQVIASPKFSLLKFWKIGRSMKKKRLTAFFFKFSFRRRSRPTTNFLFSNFFKTAYFTILQFFCSVAALRVCFFYMKIVFFSIFQHYFCPPVKNSGFSTSFTYSKPLLSYH